MKTILVDLAASFIFLGVYAVTRDVAWATAAGMIFGLGHIGWLLCTNRAVQPIQWVGLCLIVSLGTATLFTQNPLFVMLKPAFVQAALGAALLQPGWLARYLSEAQRARVPHAAIVQAGYAHPVGLFALAAFNLVLAFWATPDVWAMVHTIAPWPVFIGLGLFVWLYLRSAARGLAGAVARPS